MMKISVIVPCYNQAGYLPETLQSVLDQTYPRWECILVNDGSPDNTHEVAEEWVKKDARFKYVEKENGGLSSARNKGIEIAQGNFIQFLDSDDIIHPQKFEIQLNNLNPQTKISISSYRRFYGNIRNTFTDSYCSFVPHNLVEDIALKWDIDFTIPIHAGLFHKNYFVKHHVRFREDLKAKEDWVFWTECVLIDDNYQFEDKVLAYYRRHSDSMTRDGSLMLRNSLSSYFIISEMLPDEDFKKKFQDRLLDPLFFTFSHLKKGKEKYKKRFIAMCVVCFLLLIAFIKVSCYNQAV